MDSSYKTACCIAGAGPAGLMLGYLLARAGVDVVVLEARDDFGREFRGDTIHASTLTVLDDLGLLDAFLGLPHQEIRELTGDVYGQSVTIADFSRLSAPRPFMVLIPQSELLKFIAAQARQLPNFVLRMGAKALGVIEHHGAVVGVNVRTADGGLAIHADLVVAADGRGSLLRDSAALPSDDLGAPIDALWFRVPRDPLRDRTRNGGYLRPGALLITLNRGDHWQCTYLIPEGRFPTLRAQGIAAFRDSVCEIAPFLAHAVAALASWDDVKLRSIQVNRMPRWYRDGLLCIGDAAHAMSPVGGVGTNLAIQDAVAASNRLARPLRDKCLRTDDLAAVQRRREWPARLTQQVQIALQNELLAPVLAGKAPPSSLPLPLRLLQRVPALRRIPARLAGIGMRLERVHTPALSEQT